MKHRAPLDWQHSSSEGVLVRSNGRSLPWEAASVETALCFAAGAAGWAHTPDNQETVCVLGRLLSESQKPVGQRERGRS